MYRKNIVILLAIILSGCSSKAQHDELAVSEWKENPFFQHIPLEQKTRAKRLKRMDNFYGKLMPSRKCIYAVKNKSRVIQSHSDLKIFAKVCGHGSFTRPLSSTVTQNSEDLEAVRRVFESIQHADIEPEAKQLYAMEVLAKILPYRTCSVGQRIPIYWEGSLIHYKIDHVFDMGGGIPAYGLVPLCEKGPPLLLFRGSEFALNKRGRVTLQANLDVKGPGFAMYLRARDEVRQWLINQTAIHGKATVTGFSLGGTLAAYCLILEHEYIASATTFNMRGITKRMQNVWENLPRKPKLIAYVNQGDIVSKIGNLLGEVYEISFPSLLKPIRAHNTLLMEHDQVHLTEVDVEKENASFRL